MIGGNQRRIVAKAARTLEPRLQAAIVQLAEAHDYAHDVRTGMWEYAIEIDALQALGLSASDLRGLVADGYVRHAREVAKRGDRVRRFLPSASRDFSKRACFIITKAGLLLTSIEFVRSESQRAA